jgi:hypothetical protein
MIQIPRGVILFAILLWIVGTCLLVPFKEWLVYNSSSNSAKFVCVAVGIPIFITSYSVLKKAK